jgi:preprotein translocase subunit SecG
MAWLTTLLIVVQVLCALAIIVLVLLQHGKGADMGAAFGSGASGSLFGATGSANFLSRSTAIVATVFFLATIGLAYTGSALRAPKPDSGGVLESLEKGDATKGAAKDAPKDVPAPAAPAAGTPAQEPAKGSDVPK